jgi:hypothetical protein
VAVVVPAQIADRSPRAKLANGWMPVPLPRWLLAVRLPHRLVTCAPMAGKGTLPAPTQSADISSPPAPSTLSLSKGCFFLSRRRAHPQEERQPFDKLREDGGWVYAAML